MPNQHQPIKGVLLGFDFGMKRIGVAVGQGLTQTASPLTTLNVSEGVPNWIQLKSLLKEWEPTALIVGIPYNMDGTEQAITQAARIFAHQLHEHFSLPIFEIDEKLTTKEARTEIFARGGYKALQKTRIDATAAALILESWLKNNH